jgi:hypothetical protein
MAKLKVVVDKLEDVPEALRELYTKGEDGKYRLDADGIEDVGGLKSALAKERGRAKDLEKRLKDLNLPDDLDADRIAALLALEEESKKGSLTDKQKEDLDAFKRQLQDNHAKELGKRDERIKALTTALEEELITARATAAIAGGRGSVKLLLPHLRRQAKVLEENGKFTAVVIDEQGHTRIKGDKGTNMSFEDLVTEMQDQDDYAGAFDGSGASGGGATGGGRNGGPGGSIRLSREAAKDPAQYRAAKARAEKDGRPLEIEPLP